MLPFWETVCLGTREHRDKLVAPLGIGDRSVTFSGGHRHRWPEEIRGKTSQFQNRCFGKTVRLRTPLSAGPSGAASVRSEHGAGTPGPHSPRHWRGCGEGATHTWASQGRSPGGAARRGCFPAQVIERQRHVCGSWRGGGRALGWGAEAPGPERKSFISASHREWADVGSAAQGTR